MKLVLGIEITGSLDYCIIRNDFWMTKHQTKHGQYGELLERLAKKKQQGSNFFAKNEFACLFFCVIVHPLSFPT